MAEEKKVASPRNLSKFLLTLHLNALIGCRILDMLSAPFHADGIPIIHNDVPHITPYPEGFK